MGSSSSDVAAGGASVRIGADTAPFNVDLTKAEARLRAFGANAVAVGAKLAGFGIGIGAGMLAVAKAFANAGSALDDMAQRTGESAKNLSEMEYAAKLSGTSIQELEDGFSKMSNVIASGIAGEKTAVKLLSELGLSAAQLSGKLPTEQFAIFADKLKSISDNDKKLDLAKQIFGQSGGSALIQLINQGSAGISQLRQEAVRLGLVMSNEDAAAAAKLGDSFDMLLGVMQGVVNKVGAAMAPALSAIIDHFIKVASAVSAFVDQNRALASQAAVVVAGITSAGAAVAALGAVTYALGPVITVAMGAASVAYSAFGAAVVAVNAVVSASSAALKVALVVGWAAAAAAYAAAAAVISAASIAVGIVTQVLSIGFGILMFVVKAVAVSLAIAAVVSGLAAAGYSTLSLAVKYAALAHTILSAAQIALAGSTAIATGAMAAFGTVVAIVTNPITLAIAAIAGLVAIGVLLAGGFDALVSGAKKFGSSVVGAFGSVAAAAGRAVKSAAGEAAGPVSDAMTRLKGMAVQAFTATVSIARSAMNSARAFFTDLLKTATETFQGVSNAVRAGNIQLAIDVLWAGIKLAWVKGSEGLQNAWDMALIGIEAAIDTTAIALKTAWDTALIYMEGAIDKFVTQTTNTILELLKTFESFRISINPSLSADSKKLATNISNWAHDGLIKGNTKKGEKNEADRVARLNALGNDPEAKKRADARQGRMDSVGTGGPSTARVQAESEFAALVAQAALAAASVDPNKAQQGARATAEAANAVSQLKSGEALARGSSGAASSIAAATNGRNDIDQQQLLELKKSNKLAEEQAKKKPIKVKEHG